jgi:hypothetical protein
VVAATCEIGSDGISSSGIGSARREVVGVRREQVESRVGRREVGS